MTRLVSWRYDSYQSNYNPSVSFKFNIPPTGNYVRWDQSVLRFQVDIPIEYVPENFFVEKLWNFIELRVNHITVQVGFLLL